MKNCLIALFFCLLLNQYASGQVVWNQYQSPSAGGILSFSSKANEFYVGSLGSGVYKSSDFGITWQGTGINLGDVYKVLICDSLVYAAQDDNLYISADSGKHWNSTVITKGSISAMYIFKDTLFVGSSYGVYTYLPKTKQLILKNNGIGPLDQSTPIDVTCFTSVGNTILCGGGYNGLYYSNNNGGNWVKTSSSSGLTSSYVKGLLNNNDTLILMGLTNREIYQSVDHGNHWENIGNGLIINAINNDINLYSDSLLLATDKGLFKYNNSLSQWKLFNKEAFQLIYVQDTILLGSNLNAVYRWDNKLKLFQKSNSGINTAQVLDITLFNKRLYASTQSGLYYTQDDGTSWEEIPQFKNKYCHSLMVKDTVLFLASSGGIYSYSSKTDLWSSKSSVLTSKFEGNLINQGNDLYAATDSGVYKSSDYGENWSSLQKGLKPALNIISSNGLLLAGS